MLISEEREMIGAIAALAKEGDRKAIDYLRDRFSLRIFTYQEVNRVNQLVKEGLTINQAIDQTKEEQNDIPRSHESVGQEVPGRLQVPEV